MKGNLEKDKGNDMFLDDLKETSNFNMGLTENGAPKYLSTNNKVLDMFGMGGAYRKRSDDDCIFLFKKAFEENEELALKCLFYLRDARGGQGERRYFRVCFRWLCENYPAAAARNLQYVPEFGRWDDLWYSTEDTILFEDALEIITEQLLLDVNCKTPSLLAKWLPSENASSAVTKNMANKIRTHLQFTHKQYRKTLSVLRKKINIVERLMSENRWEEIEFDKIPSRAGLIYKNAFARRDIIAKKYETFAKDKNTKVNARTLYPYEVVAKCMDSRGWGGINSRLSETDRKMIEKYWENLEDYINNAKFNGIAVVDVSGSMYGNEAAAPINVALSLGMYCAEKAAGPYKDHFITFSSNPNLVKIEGVDFYDKVRRMMNADWGMNTNVKAVFDLLLKTAVSHHCSQDEIPENVIIISDMEFDYCARNKTPFETIEEEWSRYGYKMPKLIFWNVDARQDNIPMKVKNGVSFISGMSASLFEQVMQGKTATDLMLSKLLSDRYEVIRFVEFDGRQHFEKYWNEKWEENCSLEERQKRDKEKNQYAKEHNIPLVRIPYWERDNITLDMIMGDQYLIK